MLLLSVAAFLTATAGQAFDPGPNPMLMRHPTMNRTTIVFQFADDLWSVPREGGRATRLTTAAGVESNPYFSPDGKWIAFTGEYEGNQDVYVMPAEGGSPRRLTAHPLPDVVVGWTPDSKSILFSSFMLANSDLPRLFTVPATGGYPKPLPLPSGTMGCYSPDGSKLAYVPGIKWEDAWKRYRGGQTYPIWIAQMSDSKIKQIPRHNTNDEQPVWVGNKIYYLSDPNGPVGLFSYDVNSGTETEVVKGDGFDVKSLTAGPGGIVYEKLGSINILNTETGKSHRVPIEIRGDFTEIRPEFKDLRPYMSGASISPSGSRVAIEARGWVLTAPASKGDIHLLDDTQGVHRRDPAWSPDGKTVAYITDRNGAQQMGLYDVASSTEKVVNLGEAPAYYYAPTWSPDSKKIAYTDNRHKIWILDLASGHNQFVDETIFNNPRHDLKPRWSPDSKWLTWARDQISHLQAVFVYNVDTGKKTQITDAMADADDPVFDRNGKFLYFDASTYVGQAASWLDMSSYNALNPVSVVYAVVLRNDAPNPLQPESDEEAVAEETPAKPAKPAAPDTATRIDLDGIESRIIALPIPSGNFNGLEPGTPGTLFALLNPRRATPADAVTGMAVEKFSMSDRQVTPFIPGGVAIFQTDKDGGKALIGRGASLSVVSTAMPPAPGTAPINLSGLEVKIDPIKEWKSMFHEIWRNEKLLLYSPTTNGINVDAMDRRYEPFLANIYSREDLNYLFIDMLGEVCIGHMFPGGGDIPGPRPGTALGLLGADYSFENGHFRITRIYDGERWNPGLYAPLAQPGVHAKVGEYLLAVDGKPLTTETDVYEVLDNKVGKQVKIKLGPNTDGSGAHEATVIPIANEGGLRIRAWEEDNRRYVEKMTNGRAGYVHVPDTNIGGWVAFNRYYYAEVGRDGIVVDERFNHGGLIGDFMVHEMTKKLDAYFVPRYGKQWPTPGASIFGPKVMLANQFSGSGGDMFPWLFKHEKIGKLVGKRTWGGLIAAVSFPLVDGGRINSPDIAFYNPHDGTWDVENWGVPPDIEVELDPYEWRKGHDSQLDRAVAEINKDLASYKTPNDQHPPYPDRTKVNVKY